MYGPCTPFQGCIPGLGSGKSHPDMKKLCNQIYTLAAPLDKSTFPQLEIRNSFVY